MPAQAANGLFLPPSPTGPGGEDVIESASGTRCRQSINGNGGYLDFGLTAGAASPLPGQFQGFAGEQRDREATAYFRVTVPLGKRPARLNCTAIYELEVQRLRREIDLLRMNAQ